MRVKNLKWYSPIVLFVGTILSFADPITDILTLVEFYRADHKAWFGVGLAFVILPCLVFPVLYFGNRDKEFSKYSDTRKCTQTILCGFHPFSAAFAKLQGFVFCLKKWWHGDKIDSASIEKAEDLLDHIDYAVLFESVVESAPQFIIQLHAVSVQEKPVEVIQIISLPVSFLSLAWAFSTADEIIHEELNIDALTVKQKLALFVSYIFHLSSRLFAICYFIVSYKWWVIVVLSFHTCVVAIANNISFSQKGQAEFGVGFIVLFCCVHWLRDDLSVQYSEGPDSANGKTALRKMQMLSNVLFVVENIVMILLFYFCEFSNTWYSLPVTVCVCVFSVLGSAVRAIIFHFLLKDQSDDSVKLEANNNDIDSPSETLYWISTV